jgi:hypothetical protein
METHSDSPGHSACLIGLHLQYNSRVSVCIRGRVVWYLMGRNHKYTACYR